MLIYYDIRAFGEFDVVEPVINTVPDAGKEPDMKIDPDMKIASDSVVEVLVAAVVDKSLAAFVGEDPDINIEPDTATC